MKANMMVSSGIKKVRFIEPNVELGGFKSEIKIPISGPILLATIVKQIVEDTLVYSELISKIKFNDVYDSDIVFISINTHNSSRGYIIADNIQQNSKAIIIMGGVHASLNYKEAIKYCEYVLLGEAEESIVEFIEMFPLDKHRRIKGLVYKRGSAVVSNGYRTPPKDINLIPDRSIVYKYSWLAKVSNSLWSIVHCSRGCQFSCEFCGIIKHFGNEIRCRDPLIIVKEIKDAIRFHSHPLIPKLLPKILWLTDDNFFGKREWAIKVLNEIIKNKIRCSFVIQARVEIGYDEEVLRLMKKAGFLQIYLGIESLSEANLSDYKKSSSMEMIEKAILNITEAGIGIHGLFVFGGDHDEKGVGKKIAQFVIENDINGVLLQSLYLIPETPLFKRMEQEGRILHKRWNHYIGDVIHYPRNMKPSELQEEIIIASKLIYSPKRLIHALIKYPWKNKRLFLGEFLWQIKERKEMKRYVNILRKLENNMIKEESRTNANQEKLVV